MPPANKTSEDWPPRPHFGDLARARRIWEAGNGPTGRAERVPVDLTTMSHIPQSDLQRRVNREFWNIILAMALLAMALLLLAPAAHGATVVIYEHPDGYPYSLYDQWTDMSLTQGIFVTEGAGDTYCNGRHTGSTWEGTWNQYCHGYETQDYLALNRTPGTLYPINASATFNNTGHCHTATAIPQAVTQPNGNFTYTYAICQKVDGGTTYQWYQTWMRVSTQYWNLTPPAIELDASFTISCSNSSVVPTTCSFTDTSTGPPTTWSWILSDTTGQNYFTNTSRNWSQVLAKADKWYIMLHVENAYGLDEADNTFTLYPAPLLPVPTVLPNMTVNITPGPTVTIQTIATFGTLAAYNRTDMRGDLTDYFGNITGPFLDWADGLADGITDMGEMAFYVPNFPVLKVTEVLEVINDLGQQVLNQASLAINLVLQFAKVAANSIPPDWQLVVVWALLLEIVYLVFRGDT